MLDRNELIAQRVAELLNEVTAPTPTIHMTRVSTPRLVATRKEQINGKLVEVHIFTAGGFKTQQHMRVRPPQRNNNVAENFLKRAAALGL